MYAWRGEHHCNLLSKLAIVIMHPHSYIYIYIQCIIQLHMQAAVYGRLVSITSSVKIEKIIMFQ